MLTDGDRVHHGSHFGDTPAHDERTNTQVFFECCTEEHEAANEEQYTDVAGPVVRGSLWSAHAQEFCFRVTHHRRDSATNTPLLRRIEKDITQSLK